MASEIPGCYAVAARKLYLLGFVRAAEHLERGDLRSARAELKRFKPATFGEAKNLRYAKSVMPESED